MCLTIAILIFIMKILVYMLSSIGTTRKINARVACPSLIAPRRGLPTNMMLMLEGQGGGKGKLTSHVHEDIIAAVPQNISEPRAARTEEPKYWELGQHRLQQGSK
jgi:hypothetical protein